MEIITMGVGSRIRYLRKQRDLELQELARRASLSRPFLSQIELGTASASVKTLQRIADALGVPVVELFAEDTPAASAELVESLRSLQALVMDARLPETPTHGSGVHGTAVDRTVTSPNGTVSPASPAIPASLPRAGRVELVRRDRRRTFTSPDWLGRGILLVPDLQRLIQVIIEEHEPGGAMPDPGQHEGETFMLVLEGTFEVVVGGERFVVEEGDTIYFPAIIPHTHRVIGERPGRALWVTSPPHF